MGHKQAYKSQKVGVDPQELPPFATNFLTVFDIIIEIVSKLEMIERGLAPTSQESIIAISDMHAIQSSRIVTCCHLY